MNRLNLSEQKRAVEQLEYSNGAENTWFLKPQKPSFKSSIIQLISSCYSFLLAKWKTYFM
jgi:hypothetical protein